MLFKWSSGHARTYIRTRVCMHVRTHGQSRTVFANKHKRKRTRMQINARKLIVAMDAWVISACKRDCNLRVRSKTFRMYYMCVRIIRPFVCANCVRVYTIKRAYACAYICAFTCIHMSLRLFTRINANAVSYVRMRAFAYMSSRGFN